jgi:hypothetical protein
MRVCSATLHREERIDMASRSKSKTTFAKLAREGRLRERRLEKQAKKDARKRAAENRDTQPDDTAPNEDADARSESSANDA